MAPIHFSVNIYPESDSFFCECLPGGLGCIKCPMMLLCFKSGTVLR